MPSEIKVSRIRSLSECHRYGIASITQPWDGKTYVSSWIGASVHNRMKGGENEAYVDLTYDKTTTTFARAQATVDKMIAAIEVFGKEHKPEVIEYETIVSAVIGDTKISGVVDIDAMIDGKRVCIALVTGKQPYNVWLQLAVLGMLMKLDKDVDVEEVACLHVPRLGPRTEQRWSFASRKFAPMIPEASQWGWSLDQLGQAEYSELTASPGVHCSRCPVDDCAVRGMPRKD